MSNGSLKHYHLDFSEVARQNIRDLHAAAKLVGKGNDFIRILTAASEILRTKPNEWGDPEFRAKTIDAVMCHGIIAPFVFRFVIYEETRGVVLVSVKQFRSFS